MIPVAQAEVMLPNGCWERGMCHRAAYVRALPEGEELDTELAAAAFPITRATALLARCVSRFDGLDGQDSRREEVIRNLSMGDREALLLHARRATFGDRVDCVLRCPSCTQTMDFQLSIDGLLVPATESSKPHYEDIFVQDDAVFRFKFHLPTGRDVEAAIRGANSAPSEAVRGLVVRCVESVYRSTRQEPTERPITPEEWPTGLMAKISDRMEELDPQSEIKLQVKCPACGHEFESCFDVADFFVRELKERERGFYEQVHQLALAYHWCEADILKLSPRKRKIYLDLIAGEGIYE